MRYIGLIGADLDAIVSSTTVPWTAAPGAMLPARSGWSGLRP